MNKSIRAAALLSTCLLTLWGTQAAHAADQAPSEAIVVTGSRIRGAVPVGSPVIALDSEQIGSSKALTAVQMLQQMPQVFDYGTSENSRSNTAGGGNTTYNSSINLRGLGPFATLTLFNGHRTVPGGIGGSAIDPSVIPSLGLQRIEVVADGASALYGSDAVAGVVNLIGRKSFEGAQVRSRIGFADSYRERQLGFIVGHAWSTGNAYLAFENSYHSALSGADRDFYQSDLRPFGGGDGRVTQCAPGNISVGGVSYAIPTGGVTPATASLLVPGTINRCDNIKNTDIIPRQEHFAANFRINQDLSSNLSVYFEGFYHRRNYRVRGLPTFATLTVPSTNAFFVAPPGTSPTSETVSYAFTKEYGPNVVNQGYSDAAQGYAGFELKLPKQWHLEGTVGFGENRDRADGFPSFSHLDSTDLATALASSNPATALNVYGGTTSQAVLDAIHDGQTISVGRSRRYVAELKLDGPLFTLAGGDIRGAVGAEYVHDSLLTGTDQGTPSVPVVRRVNPARSIKAAYAELFVPLVGEANAFTLFRKLDLDAAVRWEEYSDVGETVNPKFGATWELVRGLSLRGSYGTSFRAPLLSQIAPTTSGLFVNNYPDPQAPSGTTVGLTITGANAGLKPETATTYTFGADLVPVSNLHIGVTYFHYVYRGQIVSNSSNFAVLQNEPIYQSIITRNPSQALINSLLSQFVLNGILPNGVGVVVDGRNSNLGVTVASGIDLQANYTYETQNSGTFALTVAATRNIKYDVALSATAPLVERLNVINFPLKLRLRGDIEWHKGPFDAQITANYASAYDNNLITPVQRIQSYTTFDLRAAYTFGDDWQLGANVSNLFNRTPPFVNLAPLTFGGGGGFDPQIASPVGRLVAISVSKKW